MTEWTSDELGTIGNAAEGQIAPLRPDGTPQANTQVSHLCPVLEPHIAVSYSRSYVDPIVADTTRATPLKLVPR